MAQQLPFPIEKRLKIFYRLEIAANHFGGMIENRTKSLLE
jgi:hypothetical protein